jgi:hypothetical protein
MPAESLTLALRHYCDHIRRFTPENVRLCVQLAGLLAEAATTPTAAEPADLPQTPTAVVLSEHLHGKLQPWVKRLRKTLAGSTEPPCASLEEAIEWCKRVEPAWLLSHRPDEPLQFVQQYPRYQPTPPQDAEEVPSDLLERARQLLPPLTPRHILADILECVREHTEGVGRSAWYTYLQDQPDYAPTLPMLERETRKTERMTGFARVDLAAHVLTDAHLHLPAGRISAHRIYQPGHPCGVESRKYVAMELYAPDADFDQLRALYKQVRHSLDLEGMKALSADDQEFLALVKTAIQANGGKVLRGRGSGAEEF